MIQTEKYLSLQVHLHSCLHRVKSSLSLPIVEAIMRLHVATTDSESYVLVTFRLTYKFQHPENCKDSNLESGCMQSGCKCLDMDPEVPGDSTYTNSVYWPLYFDSRLTIGI